VFGEYFLTKGRDVRIISTPGHTAGHISVLLNDENSSYFFAGDTSYTQELMLENRIDGVARDEKLYLETLGAIRKLIEKEKVVYLPSHDSGARSEERRVGKECRCGWRPA